MDTKLYCFHLPRAINLYQLISSTCVEWWYVNNHVKGSDGKEYSLFASFFRIYKGKDEDGNLMHLHAIAAGVVNATDKSYHPIALVDPETPDVLKYQIEKGFYKLDERLSRATLEVVNKGVVPLPDVAFPKAAVVSKSSLDLDYSQGNTFKKNPDGSYHVCVNAPHLNISYDITLTPKKTPQLQGHDGVVQVGIKRETMFYYFIPRNETVGTLTIDGKTVEVHGTGWYDHEFGGGLKENVYSKAEREKRQREEQMGVKPVESESKETEEEKPEKDNSYAWDWFSIQLEDGTDITATNLVDSDLNVVYDRFTIVVDPDSTRTEYDDFELEGSDNWISVRTAASYPTTWVLRSQKADMELHLKAVFPAQEIMTLLAKPGFWEGRLTVEGRLRGRSVKGVGFLERHGFEGVDSLDSFFKRISKIVREEIHEVLPDHPTYEQARELMASAQMDHYMQGADIGVLERTLIRPIREIIDRGGKSWRSYACLLCVDCVGGVSHNFRHWLAMPEIMHVGSLIVDDIQDKSETRRGGPTVHKMYGEAIAINAGTAAYFVAMDLLQRRTPSFTKEQRLRLDELYFLTLRAGHAGQAFDINGLDYMMDDVCEGKIDAQVLLDRVTCTHRLKSAVPAGNLARIGTHIGGGTDAQADAVGRYFESIGVAFQIIDDVLNLRGFEGNTKRRGEDLAMGKITYPVAYAFTQFSPEKRRSVWERLRSKPQEDEVILGIIEDLESVQATDKSVEIATKMVDDAWAVLDKQIPDSFYKLMLRAFGWYVLERHY